MREPVHRGEALPHPVYYHKMRHTVSKTCKCFTRSCIVVSKGQSGKLVILHIKKSLSEPVGERNNVPNAHKSVMKSGLPVRTYFKHVDFAIGLNASEVLKRITASELPRLTAWKRQNPGT